MIESYADADGSIRHAELDRALLELIVVGLV
jgi:hypothetical protein